MPVTQILGRPGHGSPAVRLAQGLLSELARFACAQQEQDACVRQGDGVIVCCAEERLPQALVHAQGSWSEC